jgi:hypothetical protein
MGSNPFRQRVETRYVTSSDGVRLYYAKVGSDSEIVILSARLFAFPDFQRLAKGRTLIFSDIRIPSPCEMKNEWRRARMGPAAA